MGKIAAGHDSIRYAHNPATRRHLWAFGIPNHLAYQVVLRQTSYTHKINDLAHGTIRTFPIGFLHERVAPASPRLDGQLCLSKTSKDLNGWESHRS
jgi:hypothetical protein